MTAVSYKMEDIKMKNKAFNTNDNPLHGKFNKVQTNYKAINLQEVFDVAIEKIKEKREQRY